MAYPSVISSYLRKYMTQALPGILLMHLFISRWTLAGRVEEGG